MAARFKKWRGKEVSAEAAAAVAGALGEFALRAEGHAKKELRKGHGVITGTLRRSIHVAEPGYTWSADHVEPAAGSPERGGKAATGRRQNGRITVQLGSGLNYALAVHQGHHSFEGYHFIRNGIDKAKPELGEVLRKWKI